MFDYDGPFSDAESLGHAEINFLKQSPNNLSDFWVSLSGKNARTHGSKLHLRVFLTNTKESDALPEYLERVEKEVGTKVQFMVTSLVLSTMFINVNSVLCSFQLYIRLRSPRSRQNVIQTRVHS